MKKIIYYLLFLSILLCAYFAINLLFENQSQSESQTNDSSRQRDAEIFVYETEAKSADECSSYEEFDMENNVCYFECADESECKQIEIDIDNELATWTDELEQDKEPIQEKSISSNDKSLKAEYVVTAGENIALNKGADSAEFQNIWGEIKDLSPNSLSDKYIEHYQVFDNKKDDTLAFVDDEDGNGKWRVAVNLAGYKSSAEKENKATFIHELGHIISLNLSQVNPNIEKSNCKTFFLDEGCVLADSYLKFFEKTFWKSENKDKDGSANFDENKFVTEYAATNEVEDLAESFAFFVLGKEGETGNNIKDQKIKSFYNYPELVSMRNDMRSVLKQDIIRAKKTLKK